MTLTPAEQADYQALADHIEAGDFGPLPKTARLASAEEDDALDAALAETDLSGLDQTRPTPPAPADTVPTSAVQIRRGRPRLDEETQATVTWRIVATSQLDGIVRDLSARTGRNRSAIVRDAVAAYARSLHTQ